MRTPKQTGQKSPFKIQALVNGHSLDEAQKLAIEKSRRNKLKALRDKKTIRK